jgi:hypothetical protein
MKEIIYRYGYLHSIIIDNGTNFTEGDFAWFCSVHGIRLDLASVAHPQSNQWDLGPTHGFPCAYGLNKPKQTKKSIVQPSSRDI